MMKMGARYVRERLRKQHVVEKMQNGSEESGVKKKGVKMVKGRRKEGERNK
jgi:hypothetical protein